MINRSVLIARAKELEKSLQKASIPPCFYAIIESNIEEVHMLQVEKTILDKFKALLANRVNVYKLILFGSRARGDAQSSSDLDVLVILEGSPSEKEFDFVSDCAWEAGFEYGIVVVPVVYSRNEWENSPERYSLLARAVEKDGVLV
jgi:predicted nucleotidyltransferase